MNVLLIADPPAGDKVARELEKLGCVVDYRRNVKPGGMASLIRPGLDWCLGMNTHSMGETLREGCRRYGIHYCSIPPNWSAASLRIGEEGFFKEIAAKRPAPAPPASNGLKHKPFEALKVEPPPPAPPEAEPAPAPAPPPPAPVPTPEPAPVPRPGPTDAARAKANVIRAAETVNKMEYADQVLSLAPDMDVRAINEQIAARFTKGFTGKPTIEEPIYWERNDP